MATTKSYPSTPGKNRVSRNTPIKIRMKEREAVRTRNRARSRKTDSERTRERLLLKIDGAANMLKEVKELAKALRPFLLDGAVVLGAAFDDLIADQITVAMTGTQLRMQFNKKGEALLGPDGTPVFELEPVTSSAQIQARQKLIEFFPTLIPDEAVSADRDPLESLVSFMNSGERISISKETTGRAPDTDPSIVEAIGEVIDDDGNKAIELNSANA